VLKAAPVSSNGSPDPAAISIFGAGASVHVGTCQAGSSSMVSGTIPSDFAGLKEARVEAWLQYWQPGTTTSPPPPPPPVSGAPHAAVTEVIDWTST
jgi:hypothetical protein